MGRHFDVTIEKLLGYLRNESSDVLAGRASFLIANAHLGLGKHDESPQQFE